MTQEEQIARLLAHVLLTTGSSLRISKKALDSMPPVRLVWDATSEPEHITLAVISNDLISIVLDKTDEPMEDGTCPGQALQQED